ncbi:MAG: UDP-N-acetylglucosamine 2-epimerase (hydrolyzing) [Lachnospiraceae bacterium]|nr:UDP-N-acetylglucosamine 2-epimerase (hydrolyzing) [Lachnospiraceae bacterium]
MIRLAVITATRAEYGLLRPLIEELRAKESDDLKVELIVTGTHLSEDYGMTVDEIEDDGFRIDHRISIPVVCKTPTDISSDQAVVLTKFTEHFAENKYDAIYILGDRYEMLMVAVAAMNTQTPIFHLCGGDTTEGAIDEAIRHSITKMSYLHFPTDDDSRRRIIQLGEAPDRVFNAGNTSIDNMLKMDLLDKEDALLSIDADKWKKSDDNAVERASGPRNDFGLSGIKYALCTYHPVTLEGSDIDGMMSEFLGAIEARPDIEFIVTKSNADMGGSRINEILDEAEDRIDNLHVYPSLGVRRYLSLMKSAALILGNSSSGLYEAPAMHIPTVNIGDRQKGRLRCDSVIDCSPDKESILEAIDKALSPDFARICESVVSPFGDGHAAEKIVKISLDVLKTGIDLKKRFYDLDRYR